MNDRALREIVCSLGGVANGFPREAGFDITVASEVMAIFCLANDLDDLKKRLGNIIVAYTRDRKPIRASDLKAHGAMTALLKDAIVAESGADARRHAGLHSRRAVRQYRAWLQLGARHHDRAEARRLRGDRSRLRRRSRRREIPRHQVPQDRPVAGLRRAGRHHPRAQDAWRRQEGRPEEGRPEGARSRHGQPAAPRREHPASSASCRWFRSTASRPTPTPKSRWSRRSARRSASRRCMADHWAMGGEGAADVAARGRQDLRWRQEQAQAALSGRHAAVREDPHHRQGNLPRQGCLPPTSR